MRTGIKLIVIAVLIGIAIPFAEEGWRHVRDWPSEFRESWERAQDKRPPSELAIRPGDFQKYPRQGFGFVLAQAGWDRIDTFSGTVTVNVIASDRAGTTDTTIALALTPTEMDTIYRAVIATRFFDLPEPHPPYTSLGKVSPSTEILLEVRAGTAVKRLQWSNGYTVFHLSDDWKRLNRLVQMIGNMVYSRPECHALLRRRLPIL